MPIPDFLKRSSPSAKAGRSAVAAQVGTAPLGGGGPPMGTLGPTTVPGFSVPTQIGKRWCWSAVGVGVATFYRPGKWTQCRLVGRVLNRRCCGNPIPNGCDVCNSLDASLQTVGHYGGRSDQFEAFSVVQREINAQRPMGIRIKWAVPGAHFAALYGWDVLANGTEFLHVADPLYGSRQETYPWVVSRYLGPGNTWTHSYFTTAGGAVLGSGAPDPTAPTN